MNKWALPTSFLLLISLAITSCDQTSHDHLITILATNDIHGGIETQRGPKENDRLGALNIVGGLAFFSGAVKAIKKGLQNRFGDRAGVLVLDAGDQFQGTLISNFTEGSLIFSSMNDVGYDAAITGNHDYDFGPHGWLIDDVKDVDPNDTHADRDPRGVIKELAAHANFPILSANTYIKNSILDIHGKNVDVSSQNCIPAVAGTQIDWRSAHRPEFLKPYLIKTVAGVRVAIIGIDNPETPTTTTPDNVSDLCFRDEFDSYNEIRYQLDSQADIFIMLLHDGNTTGETNVTQLARKLLNASPKSIDVVISGHTHIVYSTNVDGVPIIQSGHGGDRFGRIDLVYNTSMHAVNRDRTTAVAGARMDYAACDEKIQNFCQVQSNQDGVMYEGVPVALDQDIIAKIADARKQIAPFASKILAHADADLKVDRINESPLADVLTDAFRSASGAEIAFMNTGGMRTDLKTGAITYENLFQVIPFNNHGYVVGPMVTSKLLALLTRSIKTCGDYGALMQSGLKISFVRNCGTSTSVDPKAQLVHVETLSGEVIFDSPSGMLGKDTRVFNVATLDFLSEGGSGYSDFIGTPKINDMGVLREALSDILGKNPAQWSGTVDGRLKPLATIPAPPAQSVPAPITPTPVAPLPLPQSSPSASLSPSPVPVPVPSPSSSAKGQ